MSCMHCYLTCSLPPTSLERFCGWSIATRAHFVACRCVDVHLTNQQGQLRFEILITLQTLIVASIVYSSTPPPPARGDKNNDEYTMRFSPMVTSGTTSGINAFVSRYAAYSLECRRSSHFSWSSIQAE